ncbi:MAG: SpoIID/LytB domain-containing protein [Candidatus Eremiobacterota bacterium]
MWWLTVLLFCLLLAPAAAQPRVRIALVERGAAATVEGPGGLTLKTGDGARVLQRLSGPVRLKVEGDRVLLDGKAQPAPVLLVPSRGMFYVGERGYRGYLRLLADRGRLTAVDVLPLEDYLAGVLGGEIPADWPPATQRALAVAARTYAVYLLGDPRSPEYDLVATDQDQVYAGLDGESSASRAALAATRDQVLVGADGRVLKAYYSSNCGGHTSDSQPVFGDKVPAIAGIPDPYCAGCPGESWSRTFSVQEVRARLGKDGKPLGTLVEATLNGHDRSGRIREFRLLDSEGQELLLSGQELRRILGYRELRSTRCTLTITAFNLLQGRKVPSLLRFEGSGWGHGVGLCQWGALRMGEQGMGYRQILAHYYRGSRIVAGSSVLPR